MGTTLQARLKVLFISVILERGHLRDREIGVGVGL